MPPQSRGPSPERRSFSSSGSLPPTLRPYLENLPSPTTVVPDQRTPTARRPNLHRDADRDISTPTVTPTRLSHFGGRTDEEDEDINDLDNDDGVTLDDDDFESHYSRHSSPESEGSGIEVGRENSDMNEDEDEDGSDGYGTTKGGDSLHRVRSLPASSLDSSSRSYSQLHTSQSTTRLRAPPPPPPLYPPFYNRPPTPLPPSPSLTSLLRPPSLLNRSTTSTRPTTPDSSDAETPNDTEAAVAHSARRAHPLPPTAPKVPTYEYYGFVLYLASSLAFLMYILWSYLPSPFLHALGITYYPNRWWSLAIPAWIVMALIFVYVALLGYNVEYLTLPMASLECMVDEAGNVAILDENGRVRKGGSKRYVKELEQRREQEREREKRRGGWGGNGAGNGSGRRKRGRDRHFERERLKERGDAEWFGYLGPKADGIKVTEPNWKHIWNEGTDAVMDVPIGGVCEVLYGDT